MLLKVTQASAMHEERNLQVSFGLHGKAENRLVATAQRRDQNRLRASENTGEAARAEVESDFLQILRQRLPSLNDVCVEVILIWNLI